MSSISPSLEREEPPAPLRCRAYNTRFPLWEESVTPNGKPTGLCPACYQTQRKAEAEDRAAKTVELDLTGATSFKLAGFGLSKRELAAEWSKIPKPIRAAFPKHLKEILERGLPLPGFGLISTTGSGKTMAVAALLREWVRAQISAWLSARLEGRRPVPELVRVLWCEWPGAVRRLRDGGWDAAPAIVRDMSEVPLLVLDDLGRERIKGSYTEDWAASQLDAVVSHRYRNSLPIIWTSNLTHQELVGIYGAALVSRLFEDNPAHEIPGLPSLRLKAAP